MTKITRGDFEIQNLGYCNYPSPMGALRQEANANFVSDERHRILFDHSLERVTSTMENGKEPVAVRGKPSPPSYDFANSMRGSIT